MPLFFCFITASLSSKMKNVRILNNRAFGDTLSMSPIGSWCFRIWFWWTSLESHPPWGCDVSMIVSHKFIAGLPSIPKRQISASVLPWDTAVSFLQAHETSTNVCDPNIHRTQPDVDLESVRCPAKSASWNNPCLTSMAWLPTWQNCL